MTDSIKTNGPRWQRQRKVTSICFGEDNNAIVWSETMRQAQAMMKIWASTDRLSSFSDDLKTLSLNVLARAGFGKSYEFSSRSEASNSAAGTESYRRALEVILDHCVLLFIMGRRALALLPWPGVLGRLRHATEVFQRYLHESYLTAKEQAIRGRVIDRNLMTSLIAASVSEQISSNEAARSKGLENVSGGGLTEDEIYGNLFLFNFAGHDTTSNTLAFALCLLAINPDVQDWAASEVKIVCGDRSLHQLDYRTDFSKFSRCMAILVRLVKPASPVRNITGTDRG